MEYRTVKLFMMNNWNRDYCGKCHYYNKYCHKCTSSDVNIANRMTFNIDISYNPKEIAAISCTIDKFLIGHNNCLKSLHVFKEKIESKLPVNEKILRERIAIIGSRQVAELTIIKDDDKSNIRKMYKAVRSELYFVSAPVPGSRVEWDTNYGYGKSIESGIASSVSFDFIFTTNDTDIDAFEPHIDDFLSIGGEPKDDKIQDIILNHVKQQKINKNKNNSFYTEKLLNNIAKEKIKYSKHIYNQIVIDPSIKNSMLKHIQNRYVKPISDTLANAIVEFKINKIIDLSENKGCPHVGKKKKQ